MAVNAKGLRRDARGSIEGLPLYFMVSAVVVAVAMSALLSMMGGMQGQTLGAVEPERDTISVTSSHPTVTFNVTVKDTNGRPVVGATVVVEGLGVSIAKKTDANGKVKFTLTLELGSQSWGELEVRATFSGPVGQTTKETSILIAKA
jgi:hypothetical protein